jgi:hypothetical protein
MHPHTVDWLRNVEINADAALAQKRWDAAIKYAEQGIPRNRIIDLLRLFLFPKPDTELAENLTKEMLVLDQDFPVTGNVESLRLMAGLVMATTFEDGSHAADAFALGLRAARMGRDRGRPAVAALVPEAEAYILQEAARQRPNSFATEEDTHLAQLTKTYDAMREAEERDADVSKEVSVKKARRAYHKAVAQQVVWQQVRRLAEETQLLWWVVGDYSPTLSKRTAELAAISYALVAAAEAAARTLILPTPPASAALLIRVLGSCKSPRKKATLEELLTATNGDWRRRQVAATKSEDCRDLVPFCTALEKMEEFDDGAQAVRAVLKLCPDLKPKSELVPDEAARQYFCELSFLAALALC